MTCGSEGVAGRTERKDFKYFAPILIKYVFHVCELVELVAVRTWNTLFHYWLYMFHVYELAKLVALFAI